MARRRKTGSTRRRLGAIVGGYVRDTGRRGAHGGRMLELVPLRARRRKGPRR